jgi:hypothetical protein
MPLIATRGAASAQGFGEFAQATAVNYIENVFSTYLYTGNNTNPRTITNGIDLAGKGGLVWTKNRNNTEPHILVDTVRGSGKNLSSNNTNAQDVTGSLTAFTSSGYTISNQTVVNGIDTYTYASWTFREQPKFFDVVTYTGNGNATQTISHNLGSTPGCIFVKLTSGVNGWDVYHRSLGTSAYVQLNTTSASTTISNVWGSITDTTFTATGTLGQNDSGATYVAYLFAHNAGGFGLTGTDNVISCGTFTTDGTGAAGNITLGYESQWVMFKRSDGVGNWQIVDTMRGSSLTSYNYISPTVSSAESSSTSTQGIYPTATGFYVGNNFPAASATYIYIAIRRGPMKVPTLGTSVFAPVAYTGNNSGATGQAVVTNFPVDLSIQSFRSDAAGTYAVDRLRNITSTTTKTLQTYSTAAEYSSGDIFSGDSNTQVKVYGHTVATTLVNWNFRRAPGFFDEVCYTGTGSATTQAHNLAAIPELMIIKKRNSATNGGWLVGRYISASLVQDGVGLNVPDAFPAARAWSSSNFNSAPTSSIFGIGGFGVINASGDTYVAYLFATLAGVSKVGSYTGNGTTQTINCGFTGGARFVLIKRTDATGDWYVYDTARGMTTLTDPYLLLNSTAAEAATLGSVTTVSTGFALNSTILAAINVNAGTYIFLAIA